MSLTARDRKIVLVLIPLAIVLAYWFLLLSPKRDEEGKIHQQLQSAQSERDTARQAAAQLDGAKRSYASDYATVIYLGKSIPSSVDMPSLLVQLDRAARGTGIKFVDVKTGDRSQSPGGGSASTPPGGGSGPNAPGAPPAQSGPGQAAQAAGGAVNNANGQSGASTSGGSGSNGSAGGTGSSPAGLDNVPLDFEFKGSFFDLADFFHRMKRFVRVANNQIVVRGRLIVINSFSFDSSQSFPAIDAKVHATVYLAPQSQGPTAGATPQGPSGSTPAPTPTTASSGSPSTPAATVTAP